MGREKKLSAAGDFAGSGLAGRKKRNEKRKKREREKKKDKDALSFRAVFAAEPEEAEWVRRAGYRLLASWLLSKCRQQEGSGGAKK